MQWIEVHFMPANSRRREISKMNTDVGGLAITLTHGSVAWDYALKARRFLNLYPYVSLCENLAEIMSEIKYPSFGQKSLKL